VKKRVVISGGGTGGHVFPAIAIGQEFAQSHPDTEVLFVGANGKMEMEKVPAAGFRIVGLPVAGFQRKQLWKNYSFPFKLLISLLKSVWIMLRYKPQAAIGVGGYASGPVLRIAQLFGVNTYLQEQNAFPGATNRLLGKRAKQVFAGFPGLEKFFPADRITVSGNPIRTELQRALSKSKTAYAEFGLQEDKPVLLVLGGSLGARTINEGIAENLEAILALGVQIIWQTGKGHIGQFQDQQREGVWVGAFITDMTLAYGVADVVVSRAGALSISEIMAVQVPAIFVPSPNVTDDHQTKNANNVCAHGGGVLIKDNCFAEELLGELKQLQDAGVRSAMQSAQKELSRKDAAKTVVDFVVKETWGE